MNSINIDFLKRSLRAYLVMSGETYSLDQVDVIKGDAELFVKKWQAHAKTLGIKCWLSADARKLFGFIE